MFDGLPYVPPQPMFRRCKCGALVLKTKTGPVTPALGKKHVCASTEKPRTDALQRSAA